MTEKTKADAPKKASRGTKKEAAAKRAPATLKKEAATSTKADAVVALLSRARGATLDDMMMVTGWQAHSVRGFISGTVKKKLGRSVTSEKTAKGRIYRLAAGIAE